MFRDPLERDVGRIREALARLGDTRESTLSLLDRAAAYAENRAEPASKDFRDLIARLVAHIGAFDEGLTALSAALDATGDSSGDRGAR